MIHLATFVDSRFGSVARRFRRQARRFGIFCTINVVTEQDLDPAFLERFEWLLTRDTRGYGYYAWKPQVVLQTLQSVPDGEVVVYMDAGSHLNPLGRNRMNDYLDLCRGSSAGILAFQTRHTEGHWTKGDLLDYFALRDNLEITASGQIQAGLILVVNSSATRSFFSSWLEVFERHINLVDDSPSESPNLPGFVGHRHDQSVFSLLAKLGRVSLLPAAEQEKKRSGLTWWSARRMPVQHRRDLPGHPTKTLKARLRAARKAMRRKRDLCLVRGKRAVIRMVSIREK